MTVSVIEVGDLKRRWNEFVDELRTIGAEVSPLIVHGEVEVRCPHGLEEKVFEIAIKHKVVKEGTVWWRPTEVEFSTKT